MTVISDINKTWPEAIVDIGPIELTDQYWGIVGSIPYDVTWSSRGQPDPPNWTASRS